MGIVGFLLVEKKELQIKRYLCKANGLRCFCAVLILFSGCAVQTEQSAGKRSFIELGKKAFFTLPDSVIEDSNDVFSDSQNMTLLLLAGGATIAMNQGADKKLDRFFDRHEIFHGFADRSLKLTGGHGKGSSRICQSSF